MAVYKLHLILTKEWSCMLKVNCILDMPKLERFYKNSGKKEMIIEEWEIAKALEDLDPDLFLLHQRLVELKMEQELRHKKSLMKVSIIAQKG